MSHIFISYSRKDIDFAGRIVQALAENNLDTWIDWKSIPKGEDWEQEIYRGIEEADAFLFLISPESVASHMCNKEIAHAVKNNKRVIPIVIHDADINIFLNEISKNEISRRNWIFCRDRQDEFNKAIEETRTTIHTDYEWLKYHTELQVKALKWKQQEDNTSRLLNGKELQESERQLANAGTTKEPQPTDLQRQYVFASRWTEDRRRRRTTISLTFGLVIVTALAAFALNQRNSALNSEATAVAEANAKATALVNEENARATAQAEQERAEEKARIARAGELAAISRVESSKNFSQALLLGVEANRIYDNVNTRSAMFSSLQANEELKYFLSGHHDSVRNIAFSPNGKLLASGSDDKNIIIWDISDDYPVQLSVLTEHSEGIGGLVFSPDSKYLITASYDKTIILWDISDPTQPKLISTLVGHSDSIFSLALSPDGKLLCSGGSDGNIMLWDIADPKAPSLVSDDFRMDYRVQDVAFSPDGKILASSSNEIALWSISNPRSPEKLATLNDHSNWVNSLAFDPNGGILASGSDDHTVILWDIKNISEPSVISILTYEVWVNSIEFSSTGNTLAVGNGEGIVAVWNVSDPKAPRVDEGLNGYGSSVQKVAFSPDAEMIVAGGDDNMIAVWTLQESTRFRETRSVIHTQDHINDVIFDSSGRILASASFETITLWDITDSREMKELSTLDGHSDYVKTLAFQSDGKILYSGSMDGKIIIWDVSGPTSPVQLNTLTGHEGTVFSIALSPDNKLLASGGWRDYQIFLWDIANPESPKKLASLSKHTNDISKLDFSPNGKLLASSSVDGSVILWDLSDPGKPKITAELSNLESVTCVKFSPDGKTVAVGGWRTVGFWDISEPDKPTMIGNFDVHAAWVTSFSFSQSTDLFASASNDGVILIWDIFILSAPQQIGVIRAHTDQMYVVRFSPDDKLLASGGWDNNIILWDNDPQSWVQVACQVTGRNFTQAEWNQYFPGEPYRLTCPQWPAGE